MDSSPNASLADLNQSEQTGAVEGPVKMRVSTCEQAQSIAAKMIRDDVDRCKRRIKVQGQFNGNAPKTQAEMARAKRGGDSNINWKEFKGTIMNAWNPYFDLVCEIPVCIDATLDFYGSDIDQELMRGFAENFHEMVFGWEDFDYMNQLRDQQMLLHGPGMLFWEDEWNPFPSPILASDFYVDELTKATFSNCEVAMITSMVKPGSLWREIEDPKKATAMKWNVEAVKAAILNSSNDQGLQTLGKSWDRWEQMFKNGDIWSSTLTKNIRVANMFVQEMDGSITHLVFPYQEGEQTKGKFLYECPSRYDNWKQCLQGFLYDIGADGTFHSIKGLGTDIYPFCTLYSKINNNIADLVITGIRPMWQPASGAKIEDFNMIKFGGGNLVPGNFTLLQMDIQKGLQPAIEVSREFKNTMGQNNGSQTNGDIAPPTVEETAKSAVIRAMERAKLTKGSHNRFYRSLDCQYAEMWRRATKPGLQRYHLAKNPEVARIVMEFREKCFALCDKLQVPREALQKVKHVKAARSIGLGSPAMRIEVANAIMQQYPLLDEVGKNHALRAYLSALTSYANVDAFVPSITTGEIPTEDNSIAALENNALNTAGQVVITPRQNHVIHLNSHITSAEQDAQAAMDGQMDPREAVVRLHAKGVHSWQHMQFIQGNPSRKQEATAFGERLRALGSIQDQLEQNIAEQDQAQGDQPQPGQPDPDLVKVQGQLALKGQKQKGDMALKAQKQQFDQWLATQKAAADTRLKTGQTLAGIGLDAAKQHAAQANKPKATNGAS